MERDRQTAVMRRDEWWKNFAMGTEFDIAGRFIYNGIQELHQLQYFRNVGATFEILYNLSVGIERLQKVAIVLLEHDPTKDIQALEESLKGHSTLALSDRIDKASNQGLTSAQKGFLGLLSNFYMNRRYGRFSMESVPEIEVEHKELVQFLCKHLQISLPADLELRNDERIRNFLGRLLKGIVDGLYRIVRSRASALNLATDELQSDSKAGKVFLGTRLDFFEEDIVRRELLLFLMQPTEVTKQVELVRSIEPLPLDPALWPAYAKYLLTDTAENCGYVKDEIDVLYDDVEDKRDRFEALSLVDNEALGFENEAFEEE